MSEGTEQPTEHKLREARKKGDRPHSKDFTVAFSMLAWTAVLVGGGAYAFALLRRYMTVLLSVLVEEKRGLQLGWEMLHLLVGMGAVALIGLVIAVVPELIQTRGELASKKQFVDFNRLNPAAGLKKLFGLQRLVELAMALLRLAVIATLAWYVGLQLLGWVARITDRPWYAPYLLLDRSAMKMLGLSSLFCLMLGGVDLLVQRQLWIRRNRMKKDEIKREHKEQEGDPIIRGVRRAAHKEIAGK
jgi:type III secretion protein U